jgi:hypothetical protein
MQGVLRLVLDTIISLFRTRYGLQAENLALRHQLCVYQRNLKRPTILPADRALWSLLARMWGDWKQALVFVRPETVIRWQRKRFKDHWAKLSRQGKPGRPSLSKDLQELIRTMSRMNPTWGSPRIVAELAALGIHVSKSAVEKYMVSVRKPPSPTWRSFLENHARELVSIDLLVVHTVNFRVLYALILLSIERRRFCATFAERRLLAGRWLLRTPLVKPPEEANRRPEPGPHAHLLHLFFWAGLFTDHRSEGLHQAEYHEGYLVPAEAAS